MASNAKTREAKKPATKTDQLITLLSRKEGASLEELVGATGWLPHTARTALTGLRKKGRAIGKERVDGVTRWSIVPAPVQ